MFFLFVRRFVFATVWPVILRTVLPIAIVAYALSASAAEIAFDFAKYNANDTPTNFASVVTGTGKAGDWKIVDDEVPAALAPLSSKAPSVSKRRVLAQLSQDTTDEHFPVFIYNAESFGDFTLTTRFKCVSGEKEQMAGLAFRIQDEKNYYVVRASALGNSFRFYKFVNGARSAPIGPEIKIPAGEWHEMSVDCKGNEIRCSLDGKEAIPMLTDNSFTAGKIGLWTKSDSVSYFVDTHVTYTPRIPLAQKIIDEMMEKYPRIEGIKIIAYKNEQLQVVASNNSEEIGKEGDSSDAAVIKKEQPYIAKGKQTFSIGLPLRDRNGDAIAALWVKLKSFPGQTENNALARVLPINQEISNRMSNAKTVYE